MISLRSGRTLALALAFVVAHSNVFASRGDSFGDAGARDTVIIWDGSTDVPISNGNGTTTTLASLGLSSTADFAIVVNSQPTSPTYGRRVNVRGVRLILGATALAATCAATPSLSFCSLVKTLGQALYPATIPLLDPGKVTPALLAFPGIPIDLVAGEERGIWRLAPAQQVLVDQISAALGASNVRMSIDSDIEPDAQWKGRIEIETFNLTRGQTNQWQRRSPIGVSGVASDVVRSIALHPGNPRVAMIGTSDGAFMTTDGGITWSRASGPAPVSVGPVTFDWLNLAGFYGVQSGPDPVFSTKDGDVSPVGSDLDSPFTADPLYPSKLVTNDGSFYAATIEGLFKGASFGGYQWLGQFAAVGQLVLREAPSPGDLPTLFYTLGGTLQHSKTDGVNSSDLGLTSVTALAVNPFPTSKTVYAAVEVSSCPDTTRILKSTDDGANWTEIHGGLPQVTGLCGAAQVTRPALHVRALVTDINALDRVYALVAPNRQAAPNAIYISRDSGNTWTPLAAPPSPPMAIATRGGALFTATADVTVYSITSCAYVLSSTSINVPLAGSSGSFTLTTDVGCPWGATVTPAGGFISITSGESGTGSGTVFYSVSPNTGPPRTGTITVAGQTFTITQAGVTTMALDRTQLTFAAVTNGASFLQKTSTQILQLTQSGPGTVTWAASSNQPWLTVSPPNGIGPATLSVDIQFVQGLSGTPTATLTIALSGSANSLPPVDVTVSLVTNGASIEPIGSFDTPLDNSAGVTGSIPVTGWALDDVEVTRVRIFRDPVGTEPAGTRVFIGDAAFVDGARPDVAGLYPALPRNTRAGWGYLLLTNFLPNLGNGTFKLYAVAEDADGHTTVFGPTTITCTNSSASTPFGANDTPGQGERVSGIVHNFGWVLSPKPGRADVPGGGSVTVLIDGLPVGTPGGWTSRPDLTLLFGGAYDGVSSALAVFTFDSRTLSNGVHTIAWLVNDNLGRPAGVGSRFFTVSNSSLVAAPVTAPTAALQAAARGALEGRRGVVADAPLTTYEADADGVITIEAEELDRIELKTGATAGHLVTPAGPAPLPIGSRIDPEDGTFTWLAGVGFVGRYDFVFDTPAGRRDVTIVLHPKRAATAGAQVVIDLPGPSQTVTRAFSIAGWAADLGAPTGTGIDAIHVWAYPVDGTDPVFLGSAELGVARPDVAAAHGARVASSGYQLRVQDLAPGTYDLAIFPWVASLNGFAPAQVVRVTVR